MKFKLLIAATSLVLTHCSVNAEVDLLITGGTIITPINKHQTEMKTDHWIAIQGNQIVKIGSSKQPDAKKVISADGKFIIPGLMDSHTHLKTMPGLTFRGKNAKQMQSAFLQRQGHNYLYYGVTQVIDPSNNKEGMDKFQSRGLSPDAFFCGAMPVLNGYNAVGIPHKKLHKKRPYYVSQQKDPVIDPEIKFSHVAEKSVARVARDGAVCAKVYLEDGFDFANHIPMIHQENLEKLTQKASELKLPVMAHANATDMQKIAVNSGINVLGHGLWNWLEEQRLSNEEQLPPKVTNILDQIIKKDIAYQATTNVMRSLRDLMVKGHLEQQDYLTVLPQWQIDWYTSKAGQWFATEMFNDWGGASLEHIINSFSSKLNNGFRVVKYLYDGGATILLGSDSPPAPTYASQPGLASYTELKSLYQAGIDLKGVLAAATLNNAKAYNMLERYGTVEQGKIANILLLNSNPLQSIEAYNDIDTVVLQGNAIKRETLHVNKLNQLAP